ncbi:hypothetical protein HII31_12185 [Pseudocercospora fuligena]|uniref:Uncharacterized protein n=1 Tax=Pseudocercospora fuligena TaxID=685502 RepID=A0A8H6R8J4_9PEZI|nr:hypothetical protein HII31_12185 [Pseudocercospora fuligena]
MSAWQVQISYMDCEGDFPVIRFLPLGTRDDPPIQPGKEIATVPDYKSVTTTVRSGTGCPKVPTTVRGAENATDAWKVEASPPANSKSVAPKGTVVASSTLLPSSATTEEGLPRCTKAGSHFNVTKNISAALFSAIGYAQLSIGSMFEQKPSRQQQTILPLFRHASIKEW